MPWSKKEEREEKPDIFFHDLSCVHLPCGASIVRVDQELAEIASVATNYLDSERFREGDAALVCRECNKCLDACPLIERFLKARTYAEIEGIFNPLFRERDFYWSGAGLPYVGDCNPCTPEKLARVKLLIDGNRDNFNVLVPPMLPYVEDADDGADAGDDERR